MENLKEAYTDIRNRTHPVKHVIVQPEGEGDREHIMEELFHALTATGKKIQA